MKIPLALMTIALAGTLGAQTPNSGAGSNRDYSNQNAQPQTQNAPAQTRERSATPQTSAERRSNWMVRQLTNELNLTQDQQQKVRGIFADAHKSQAALEPQVREEHLALKSAVKSGNDAEIDRILQSNSQLNTQLQAMHVKAMAKVYRVLTPDQQAKFDSMDRNWFGPSSKAAAHEKTGGE